MLRRPKRKSGSRPVHHSGRRLRSVVQLTDAATGYQVWSESFDRTSMDALAMQEDVAGAIAKRIAITTNGAVAITSP
jgi:TolB-like protein